MSRYGIQFSQIPCACGNYITLYDLSSPPFYRICQTSRGTVFALQPMVLCLTLHSVHAFISDVSCVLRAAARNVRSAERSELVPACPLRSTASLLCCTYIKHCREPARSVEDLWCAVRKRHPHELALVPGIMRPRTEVSPWHHNHLHVRVKLKPPRT